MQNIWWVKQKGLPLHPLSTRKQPQTSGDKKEVFENKLEVLKNWHKSQSKRVPIAKNFLDLLGRKEIFEKMKQRNVV